MRHGYRNRFLKLFFSILLKRKQKPFMQLDYIFCKVHQWKEDFGEPQDINTWFL